MTKQQFEPVNLRKASLNKLDQINSIIEEYQVQGYSLTLRACLKIQPDLTIGIGLHILFKKL